MLIYNIAIDVFPVSYIVVEKQTLTPEFTARKRCKKSRRIAHGPSTTSRQYFSYYSWRSSKVKGIRKNFTGFPEYIIIFMQIQKYHYDVKMEVYNTL